jgi:hypothetical protein
VFRGLTDLIEPIRHLVPPEILAAALAVLVVIAAPAWWRSVRVRQIKGHLRRAARAHDDATRERELDGAFRLAGGSPRLLVDLAEHAIRAGQHGAWRRAVATLDASGRLPLEVRRLRREVEPPRPALRDADEAAVRARRLLDLGLTVAAREVLDEARARFPEDPDIAQLVAALPPPEPPPSAEEP